MQTRSHILQTTVFWIAALTIGTSGAIRAEPQVAGPTKESCRTFVRQFYDWYVVGQDVTSLNRALRVRRSAFSPELFRLLKEDIEAQAKAPRDVDGLDFDPLIGGQDSTGHYGITGITIKSDGRCWPGVIP